MKRLTVIVLKRCTWLELLVLLNLTELELWALNADPASYSVAVANQQEIRSELMRRRSP